MDDTDHHPPAPFGSDRWRLYAIEATLLGLFMLSASAFTILLEHPSSPVRQSIDSSLVRRGLIGLAMGLTAIALIYSPLGKRSGAHMNPAMTLCFFRMGRITGRDAACYAAAQFIGGMAGMTIAAMVLSNQVMDPAVNYVATVPGPLGRLVAWIAEFVIAAILISAVLWCNKRPRVIPYTGVVAGCLVALYITFEAPLSGMSLNPARTFASAAVGQVWTSLWVYFTAPVAGLLAGVEINRLLARDPGALCGKLTHSHTIPCVIRCNCVARRGINTTSNPLQRKVADHAGATAL